MLCKIRLCHIYFSTSVDSYWNDFDKRNIAEDLDKLFINYCVMSWVGWKNKIHFYYVTKYHKRWDSTGCDWKLQPSYHVTITKSKKIKKPILESKSIKIGMLRKRKDGMMRDSLDA